MAAVRGGVLNSRGIGGRAVFLGFAREVEGALGPGSPSCMRLELGMVPALVGDSPSGAELEEEGLVIPKRSSLVSLRRWRRVEGGEMAGGERSRWERKERLTG